MTHRQHYFSSNHLTTIPGAANQFNYTTATFIPYTDFIVTSIICTAFYQPISAAAYIPIPVQFIQANVTEPMTDGFPLTFGVGEFAPGLNIIMNFPVGSSDRACKIKFKNGIQYQFSFTAFRDGMVLNDHIWYEYGVCFEYLTFD